MHDYGEGTQKSNTSVLDILNKQITLLIKNHVLYIHQLERQCLTSLMSTRSLSDKKLKITSKFSLLLNFVNKLSQIYHCK